MTPAEVGSLSFICTRQPCKVDTKGESVLLYEPVRFVCLVPTASPCPSFPKETKRERERESEREREIYAEGPAVLVVHNISL